MFSRLDGLKFFDSYKFLWVIKSAKMSKDASNSEILTFRTVLPMLKTVSDSLAFPPIAAIATSRKKSQPIRVRDNYFSGRSGTFSVGIPNILAQPHT